MSVDAAGRVPARKAHKKKPAKEGVGSFVVYFVMMCIFGALMASVVMFTGPQFVDDVRLHYGGTLPRESSCEIYVLHGSKGSTSDLIVTWKTQEGVFHVKTLDIMFLWGPNQKKPCVVRYDAARPTHVTASWGFQCLISRLVVALFCFLITLIGVWAMGSALVMGIGRRLGWVKEAEPEPDKSGQKGA